MKRTTYYLILGLISISLIGTTACNSSKKTGKKKKYNKKCGTCPTWGQGYQKNQYFSIIDEEKI
jgi:hypothetical protein